MGAWDYGPYDNDTAADWCGDLHDAEPGDRPWLLRAALTETADYPADEYLDMDDGSVAVVAAAIAAAIHKGEKPEAPYGPDFLLEGGTVELPDEVGPLVLRALDRVTGENSEWRSLWDESGALDKALATLEPIRAAFGG